jgi:anti-sigma B factor antagonist
VPAGDRHEPGWPVQVSTEVRDGVGFIAVVGEVDGSTSAELRDAFLAVLGDGARDLVIDCAELTFIDSSGLGALITANRAASLQFGSVTIRNPSAMVLRLLEITGLDSRLVIER